VAAQVAQITIEYSGANQPVQPKDSEFKFDSMMPAVCKSPRSPSDSCVTEDVMFAPTALTDAKGIEHKYFDNHLDLHGYVPFRLFPLNNQIVVGTPTKPSIHMLMTNQDPGTQALFNTIGAPKQLVFSSNSIQDRNDKIDKIPFTVEADKIAGLYDVDYKCTTQTNNSCYSQLTDAEYLKTYASESNTHLAYKASSPTGFPLENETDIPVSLTLTRSFVVTTNQGEAYALNNPTKTDSFLLDASPKDPQSGTFNPMPLDTYVKGEAITSLILPARNSTFTDFIKPLSTLPSDRDLIMQYGLITSKDHDEVLLLPGKDMRGENFIARTRMQYGAKGNRFDSLVINTDTSDKNTYHLVGAENVHSGFPYIQTMNSLPKLSQIVVASTYPDVLHNTGSNVTLVAGWNDISKHEELYDYDYFFADSRKGKLDSINVTQLGSYDWDTPVVFDYNSYTELQNANSMLAPQQKLLFFDQADSEMVIIGYDLVKESLVTSKVKLPASYLAGVPQAFACSDTQVGPGQVAINNTCYLVSYDSSNKTTPYHAYYFKNLDVDGVSAKAVESYGPISFSRVIQDGVKRLVIDGNTGSLLTLDQSENLALYNLLGMKYQQPQPVILPKTPSDKTQTATNIFEY
jgi:hypothetical protein